MQSFYKELQAIIEDSKPKPETYVDKYIIPSYEYEYNLKKAKIIAKIVAYEKNRFRIRFLKIDLRMPQQHINLLNEEIGFDMNLFSKKNCGNHYRSITTASILHKLIIDSVEQWNYLPKFRVLELSELDIHSRVYLSRLNYS